MIEDGANMEAENALTKDSTEKCPLCHGALYSLNTRNVGSRSMCYTCGMPIQHLLTVVNGHITAGIIALVNDGMTIKQACIRAGVRHLDVKQLTELEALL